MRIAALDALLALFFIAIGSARIVSTHTVFSHTIDEPAHLAAGMEWIDGHKYRYEDFHGPLARVFGAMGPYLAGERWSRHPNVWQEGYRLLGHGDHYDRTLALGRLGILPFFWMASAVVFLWCTRIAGSRAGVFGVFLFTTLPPVLAHSGLITTDMAATACIGAAALASLYWTENPNLVRTRIFGITLALAVLAKLSALVFLPVAWALMGAIYLLHARPDRVRIVAEIRARLRPACKALGVAALGIWAGYLFSFHAVDYLHLRLPAPAFFTGLRSLFLWNSEGTNSYLLGERSIGGFWYYFPVVLSVKIPLGLLILLAAAIWLTVRYRDRLGLAMPLAFSFAILLVAMMSRINIGSRHVLPLCTGVAVACGIATAFLMRRGGPVWGKCFVVALLGWQAISGARQHPDYLAYTNEIAGDHPEDILVDSDLGWGQDMKRLSKRLKELGVKEVTLGILNRGYLNAGHPLPHSRQMADGSTPPPGWSALSTSKWKLDGQPTWPGRVTPVERVGRTIDLYYVAPN